MNGNHLTDQQVQEYAFNSGGQELPGIQHLEYCEACSLKVKNYQQILTGINEQPVAEFDFNLSALVIGQVRHRRAAISNPAFLWISVIIVLAITLYLSGIYLSSVFPGVSTMTFYLVSITATALLIFQGMEIFRKYKQHSDALDVF